MQCQLCKEHVATIHLTEISNGQRVETHLCESCAQEQGLAVKSQIPLNELLNSLLASQSQVVEDENADTSGSAAETICPHCGMTLKQLQKGRLLGCSYDYEVFDRPLRLIIEKTQAGHTAHRGKVPARAPQNTVKQVELMNLRLQLDNAVKAEDYETAAKLRDKIGGSDETK